MFLDTFFRDIRVGFRVLVKDRSFCGLAVTALALGICGVTTMFSVVNGVMLRGFSFPNEARLASANFIDPTSATFFGVNGRISSMDYQDLLPQQQSFDKLAAFLNGSTVNVTVDGQPRRYTGAYVTEHFFGILGVTPVKGRDFTAADNVPGAEKVAILGYALWQRDFGGDEQIVGRAVRINGKPATVVGVMQPGFAFPTNEELWVPLFSEFPPRPRGDPLEISPAVVGLLKAGVSPDEATLEFTAMARRFADAYPESNRNFTAGQVQPLIQTFTPAPLRGTLWTMLAFCVGVLLIACVNVMNMQFARATARVRELAIRSSLGGSRARLIRQMLTESLLVASLGAAAGVALAYGAVAWLTRAVRGLENPPPAWITFDIDGTVLAATVGATILAAVVSGTLPALVSSRMNANAILRDGTRGATGRSVGLISRALVVFQLVVTCVLLIGSLLQLRSITNQGSIDYGYDTGGLMSARMGLMDGDYPTPAARKAFYDRLLPALQETPELAAVGLTNRLRMVFSGTSRIEIDGRSYSAPADRPTANFEQVTSGFFDVTQQTLLEGRAFAADDLDTRQPVAIVNAAFAARHFGRESALGRRFRSVNPDGTQPGPWRTIVGVVSTVRMLGPFNNPGVDETGYYVPFFAQPAGPAGPAPVANQFATILARPQAGRDVAGLANVFRRVVAKVDPNLPLYFVGTPQAQLDGFVAQGRIIAAMFSIFGIVAVVLAAVGIYGVMSFSVSQRTQEFGVRMALGADARRILAMVLRQGGVQITVGVVLGLVMAFGLAMAIGAGIQNLLFGVSGREPLVYAAVAALVVVVSLAATLLPAARATQVRPMIALRAD
jgi:putative ABC transport system permease protein